MRCAPRLKRCAKRSREILAANERDMQGAASNGAGHALLDRLKLDPSRIEAMARALEDIAELPDPIGTVLAEWTRPNGLRIQRRRVPLGVIGIIYESRPNVTADAGALCLKSGNAVILRGGSESARSSELIHQCLIEGLLAAGLPATAIQRVPTTDRAAVGFMLADMAHYIDVIVPRGGKSLIERVQKDARVPVIGHLEGSVTSSSSARRIWRWRATSCSMRSCAAPVSAARRRRCWWIAGVPTRTWRR